MTDDSAELGHVHLEVADLERSAAFYTRFLGLSVSERMESRKGRMIVLSGGERHSEVTLRAAPDGDGDAGTGGDDAPLGTGGAFSAPFQIGFELPGRGALADLLFELRKAGIPTTAVDHGVSWSVYFHDPDGNALEAYWDTRDQEGGRRQWEGRSQLLALSQILSEERMRELVEMEEDDEEPEEEPEEEDEPPVETGPADDRSATSD